MLCGLCDSLHQRKVLDSLNNSHNGIVVIRPGRLLVRNLRDSITRYSLQTPAGCVSMCKDSSTSTGFAQETAQIENYFCMNKFSVEA